jgi:glycosyltransferase involved in cell wall biosynthesis
MPQVTFAAVVGVKDEVELIDPCIEHLRSIGVGRIQVMDCGSTDGSVEAVVRQCARGDVTLTQVDDLDPDPRSWSRAATALARSSGAEWVLFLDADEYWIPATGSIASIAGLDALDVLTVDRFNVPLDRHGLLTEDRALPRVGCDASLIVRSLPDFRARLASDPDLPWIRIVPVPKVMARAERIADVDDGFHGITATEGAPLRSATATDLLIAHVPFTTLPRFARKVENIRRIFAVHDAYCGDNIAWHWRRLLACEDDASIREEFERQVFNDTTMEALRAQGVIARSSEWFSAHRAADIQ